MVKNAQIIKSELFQELSEQEQENISGGRSDFFLKLTQISSSSNIKISSLNTTIEINSTYTFTELIISSKGRGGRNKSLDSVLKLLSRLL